jgi:hypothetical protein
MKLIIHIGTEKTGTTILQEWLYSNQKKLSEGKVFLSNTLDVPSNRKIVAYFQEDYDDFHLEHNITNENQKSVFFDGFTSNFSKEINSAKLNHDFMIITAEHFHSRLVSKKSISDLNKFLRLHFEDIKIICYLRNQADLRKSLYSTACKVSLTESIADFHRDVGEESDYYNYFSLLNKWSEVFGKENLLVRVYDRNKFIDSDIRKDFILSVIPSFDLNKLTYNLTTANESLSYLESRAFVGINKTQPAFNDHGGVNQVSQIIKSIFLLAKSIDYYPIVDLDSVEFFHRFDSSNLLLYKTFCHGEQIFREPNNSDKDYFNQKRFSLDEIGLFLENLARVICNEIDYRLLFDRHNKIFYEISSKALSDQTLNKNEILFLLDMALRAKPFDPVVLEKIEEVTAKM